MTLMIAFVTILILLIFILVIEIVKLSAQLDDIDKPDDGERM